MPDSSPTVRRRRLAYELRRLREDRGMTIEEVAVALECSESKISRIEKARVKPTPRDVRDLADLYRIDGEDREKLITFAREARQRGWWHAYGDDRTTALVGYESAATALYVYSALLVPGLLQTERYARAVLAAFRSDPGGDKVDATIGLRRERQERFKAGTTKLLAVIDEAVLRRLVGGRDVMRQQLEYLANAADQPNITLLVLPSSSMVPVADGQFTIIDFADPDDSDMVYMEGRFNSTYLSSVENPVELRAYKDTFKRLRSKALSPTASRSHFVTRAKELQGKPDREDVGVEPAGGEVGQELTQRA